jgi:hypothetical protein
MSIHRSLLFVCLLLSAFVVRAHPTGAPLAFFALEPCRVLDTRVSLDPEKEPLGPIGGQTASDLIFVRGSNLLPEHGAQRADCGVPASAEAVAVNFTVIGPLSGGHLRINGPGQEGAGGGVNGPYSRLTYRLGQNDNEEMTVGLCNANAPGFPHVPCAWDADGHFADIQVFNAGPVGSSVHLVADIVGYYAAME